MEIVGKFKLNFTVFASNNAGFSLFYPIENICNTAGAGEKAQRNSP